MWLKTSDKANEAELNKTQRPGIDKFYFYTRDPFESKCQLLMNGREKIGTNYLKVFVDYSETIDDVYKNLDYNPTKKKKCVNRV